uniref:PadR family transcriptional regulator n=1 Tax=uncultured Altererythrobacter sp. TaxID=500840 RepID=UPI00261CC97F|nr:PadR family transcriptional regulator [uncultured Altererythrobacter sp.]
MIVLALIGTGLRYGFEMERFARRTEMRQWAKIGMSTIYKVLKDLELEGAVTAEPEESGKGPPRKAYRLTTSGKQQMSELIREALASDASVYSERIAGLLFAPLLGPKLGCEAVSKSIAGLKVADTKLADSLGRQDTDQIGKAIIEYYQSIYEAERVAMRKILAIIASSEPDAKR